MKLLTLVSALLTSSLCTFASPTFSASSDDDRGHRLWLKDQQAYREKNEAAPDSDQPLLADPLSLSLEGKTYKLGNNSQDLGLAVYLAVNHRQFRDAERLIPLYSRLPDHDPLLVLFARAEIARDEGRYSRAIALYRHILDRSPGFLRIRLELARALYQDNQNKESLALFDRILSENGADLPAGTIETIKQFTGAIEDRTAWTGSLSFGYGYNSNVNQTPDRDTPWLSGGGIWSRDAPADSGDVNWDASLSKLMPVSGHHSLLIKGTSWGDRYPGHSEFSENTTNLALQYQFSDAASRLAVGPVGELKISAEKTRYTGTGLKLDAEHSFTPRLMVNLSSDWQKLSYKKPYQDADGHRENLYLTGIFGLTPQTSLFAGVDGTRVTTQVRSDDYYQTGLRMGFFSALTPDIQLLAIATRRYTRFGEYNTFIGNARRDRGQMYMARLSAPGWKLLSFSPFISYRYRVNYSSADGLYSYQQHEIITGLKTNF
jgi:outer membrane protein